MFPPGAPFALTDHTGKKVTDEDYRGKFMLIAFGYTYCPDVCPTGLAAMSVAVDLLGEQADWVQPIFITIDPERDTPEVLKEYVTAFHPRLIGLSGTRRQIADAAEGYRVYFNKLEPLKDEDGDDDDYLMGHTTSIYLVGTDGKGDFLSCVVFQHQIRDIAGGLLVVVGDDQDISQRHDTPSSSGLWRQ